MYSLFTSFCLWHYIKTSSITVKIQYSSTRTPLPILQHSCTWTPQTFNYSHITEHQVTTTKCPVLAYISHIHGLWLMTSVQCYARNQLQCITRSVYIQFTIIVKTNSTHATDNQHNMFECITSVIEIMHWQKWLKFWIYLKLKSAISEPWSTFTSKMADMSYMIMYQNYTQRYKCGHTHKCSSTNTHTHMHAQANIFLYAKAFTAATDTLHIGIIEDEFTF